MLRIAHRVTVDRNPNGDVYAIEIEGGFCAEHENGMSPFARGLGLVPHGYGLAQRRGWTLDARFLTKMRAVELPDFGARAVVIGGYSRHLKTGDGARLVRAIEDDIQEQFHRVPEGVVAAYDEYDVVLIGRSHEDRSIMDWVVESLTAGRGVFFPAFRSLVIADREASHPARWQWAPVLPRKAA